MGFFRELFKKNKTKMIEAPKEEKIEEIPQRIENTEKEEKNNLPNDEVKETIMFQIEKSLENYKEWYEELENSEEKKYGGAIDIIGVRDGTDIVILNCLTRGNKEDKIVLAIVNIPGENRTEKLKFLRQKIDSMLCALYNQRHETKENVDINNYLKETMKEIKNKIFDIEFTNEGEFLLSENKQNFCILDRTVQINMGYQEDELIINDYQRMSSTFQLPDDAYAGSYTTVITTPVIKMDMNQAKYKKEHYIRDLQKLGNIAEVLGLLNNKSTIKTPSISEYNDSLRDALIMLKNSKYSQLIEEIKTMDDLKANVTLVVECVRNLIGDSYSYYENIAEEVVYGKSNYNNVRADKEMISATLYLSKQVQNERAEYLKSKSAEINRTIQSVAMQAVEEANQELIQSRLKNARITDIEISNDNQKKSEFRDKIKVSKEDIKPIDISNKSNLSKQNEKSEK